MINHLTWAQPQIPDIEIWFVQLLTHKKLSVY